MKGTCSKLFKTKDTLGLKVDESLEEPDEMIGKSFIVSNVYIWS